MSTFAPKLDARLEARERAAWTIYKDSLDGLDGMDYEDAEVISWARLQDSLRQIAADRESAAAETDAEADADADAEPDA
jgi:hypothetical protein